MEGVQIMNRYIPNQHGAWAMLVLPFLVGMLAARSGSIHILLFVCWLLAYLFSYPVLQWIRTGKPERYRKPAQLYGALLIPAAGTLLLLRPGLLWYGLVLAPFLLINIFFARRNRERAFWNDMAAIAQFCTIVFPAYALGGGEDWSFAAWLALVCLLYFAGTVFYVKTVIRERRNPTYYAASITYHAVLLVLAVVLKPGYLILPLAILLLRAIICPKTGMSVKQTGIMEIGMSVMVLITVCLVWV